MTNWLVVYKTEQDARFEGYSDSFRAVNRYAKLKKQYRVVHFCEVIPPGGKLDAIKREESGIVSHVSRESLLKIRRILEGLVSDCVGRTGDDRGIRIDLADLAIWDILDPVDESPDEVRPVVVTEVEFERVFNEVWTDFFHDEKEDDKVAEMCARAVLKALGLRVNQAAPDNPSALD